jgi:type IV pilus assembly protein PilC
MSKQTVSNEYVSAFCLEMSLLLHAGIGIEDGLYLLIEDEKDKKSKKMPANQTKK